MPRYRVYYTAVVSSSVVLEAANEDDARDAADDEFAFPSICAQCSGWGQDYSMDLGEWEQDESDEGLSLEAEG